MSRLHVAAILDTMWGDEPGEAPPFFKINRNNHSGRRLYSHVGDSMLMVTDSCRELVTSAKQHGKPDPEWLAENLAHMQKLRPIDVLLVCGKVAKATYREAALYHQWSTDARVIEMPHPAARSGWTKEYIERLRGEIQRGEEA